MRSVRLNRRESFLAGLEDPRVRQIFRASGPQVDIRAIQGSLDQSGTKPNLVAKILATKIGNLWV